jgi:hypothetical protein
MASAVFVGRDEPQFVAANASKEANATRMRFTAHRSGSPYRRHQASQNAIFVGGTVEKVGAHGRLPSFARPS